ncbi:hypothetical protein HK102_006051, partial [Quaeritorhiza haematococci]
MASHNYRSSPAPGTPVKNSRPSSRISGGGLIPLPDAEPETITILPLRTQENAGSPSSSRPSTSTSPRIDSRHRPNSSTQKSKTTPTPTSRARDASSDGRRSVSAYSDSSGVSLEESISSISLAEESDDRADEESEIAQEILRSILKRQECWEAKQEEIDKQLAALKSSESNDSSTSDPTADFAAQEALLISASSANGGLELKKNILSGLQKIEELDTVLRQKTAVAQQLRDERRTRENSAATNRSNVDGGADEPLTRSQSPSNASSVFDGTNNTSVDEYDDDFPNKSPSFTTRSSFFPSRASTSDLSLRDFDDTESLSSRQSETSSRLDAFESRSVHSVELNRKTFMTEPMKAGFRPKIGIQALMQAGEGGGGGLRGGGEAGGGVGMRNSMMQMSGASSITSGRTAEKDR